MTKYRTREREVDAIRYPGPIAGTDALIAVEDWLEPRARPLGIWPLRFSGHALVLPTLIGDIEVQPGDWILYGDRGEFAATSHWLFKRDFVEVEG
jgi:hypothetical protein